MWLTETIEHHPSSYLEDITRIQEFLSETAAGRKRCVYNSNMYVCSVPDWRGLSGLTNRINFKTSGRRAHKPDRLIEDSPHRSATVDNRSSPGLNHNFTSQEPREVKLACKGQSTQARSL